MRSGLLGRLSRGGEFRTGVVPPVDYLLIYRLCCLENWLRLSFKRRLQAGPRVGSWVGWFGAGIQKGAGLGLFLDLGGLGLSTG